jgi:RNA polymerase sigma factor (sigma-70 family)
MDAAHALTDDPPARATDDAGRPGGGDLHGGGARTLNRPVVGLPRPSLAPLPSLSDAQLARRAGAGDDRAFEVLHHRFATHLYRYCRVMLGHHEDAEEALQSLMLRAYSALRTGVRPNAVRPWLYRIAHNECLRLIGRRRAVHELTETEPARDGGPGEHAQLRERLHQLLCDLDVLPPAQRAALVMRELGGLSHQAIGEALQERPEAVKQLIYAARQSLAEFDIGRDMPCTVVRRRLSDGDGRRLRARPMRAHLRSCQGCQEFRQALVVRPQQLAALAPLPPLLAAHGVLGAILGPGSGGGAAGSLLVSGGPVALSPVAVGAGTAFNVVLAGAIGLVVGSMTLMPRLDATMPPSASGPAIVTAGGERATASIAAGHRRPAVPERTSTAQTPPKAAKPVKSPARSTAVTPAETPPRTAASPAAAAPPSAPVPAPNVSSPKSRPAPSGPPPATTPPSLIVTAPISVTVGDGSLEATTPSLSVTTPVAAVSSGPTSVTVADGSLEATTPSLGVTSPGIAVPGPVPVAIPPVDLQVPSLTATVPLPSRPGSGPAMGALDPP